MPLNLNAGLNGFIRAQAPNNLVRVRSRAIRSVALRHAATNRETCEFLVN